MVPLGPEDISQVGAIVKSTFLFFEAFMIWYTHHSWKKLEGNHFKNLWETKIFGLAWF